MAETIRFYDVETGGPIQIQLEQSSEGFRVLRQFGYRDPVFAGPFIVPKDTTSFRTDLASIPWFFAWLVPGLGTHLPAVLLHDGLVVGPGESPTHIGPPVDRVIADRILRDAMANLGTPRIRRWIMWAAVTLATAWSAMRPRWRWRSTTIVTIGTVLVLGTIATLDLFDVWDALPWMANRPWWIELLLGALFALLIPLAISVLWGRLWTAAAIDGVLLAFLFHVTMAIFVLFGIYRIAEWLVSRGEGSSGNARKSYAQAIKGGSRSVSGAANT
jgi:hypothetical protein